MSHYTYLIKFRNAAEVFEICLGCAFRAAEMLDKQLVMRQIKVLVEAVDYVPRTDNILKSLEIRRDRQVILHTAVKPYLSLVLSLKPRHFRLKDRHVFGRHTPALALDGYVGTDPEGAKTGVYRRKHHLLGRVYAVVKCCVTMEILSDQVYPTSTQ